MASVFRKHREDKPVNEVRDPLRVVAAAPQAMGKTGKPFSSLLGERLAGQARLQPFGIAENALEDLALAWVDQF